MKILLSYNRFIFFILLITPFQLVAQSTVIDSLKTILLGYEKNQGFEKDTNYINVLNDLAFRLTNINPDTATLITNESMNLSNKINYTNGKIEALKNSGLIANLQGDFNKGLAFFEESLALANQTNNIKSAGKLYHNIGISFGNLGNYSEALNNYFQALKIREAIGDKIGISSSVNAIGAIYFTQGKYEDALTNYQKALRIAREINYQTGIQAYLANIGEVYFRQGKYTEAREYLQEAWQLTNETGDKETKSFIVNLIAAIYAKENKYSQAIEAYKESEQLALDIGSREYQSRSYLGLGNIYLLMKDFNQALKYTELGFAIARETKFNELIRDGNELLSKIYEAKGDALRSLGYYKQYKAYADSMNNQQSAKITANLAAEYEFSKKEIVLKAEQEKAQIAFQKKTNQQRWIIFSAFAALLSALVVTLLVYRSRQKEKHANLLLQHKNTEIDQQKNKAEKALEDLKTTQALLIQSEKMASLGELTAGIAHEIQNPLNFVNNFSEVNTELIEELEQEVAKENLDEVKVIAKNIKENEQKINHHGKRADAIVKGMLQHSRSSSAIKEPTSINLLADEYLRLAYHGLRAKDKTFNATMKTNFDSSLEKVSVVPQDLGRVILNLITNAFYVVNEKKKQNPEGYEPTVTISTKKEKNKILISVKDNGNGIPQKIMDKIFQPFFTTKPTGQGTGLGLSLSYDIVKAHEGELKVETKEGEGTEFVIQLPMG